MKSGSNCPPQRPPPPKKKLLSKSPVLLGLKKGVITEMSGMDLGYFSPVFLRENKDDKSQTDIEPERTK